MNALVPARTALLIMGLQTDILAMLGERPVALLDRTARLLAAARAAQVQVIYICAGFRPGYPEVPPRSPLHARFAASGKFMPTVPGEDIAPELAPAAGDLVVLKHRVSAFHGTELEMILRAQGIDTLILAGVATSGVVLSTVRHASDADYHVIVVADACLDRDEEVHRVLVEKVFARHTTVTTVADAVTALGAA